MRAGACVAAVLAYAAAAGAALPSDGGRIAFRVAYSDRGSVLQSIPLPDDNWAEVEENDVFITAEENPGGLFDGLEGRCVAMTPTSPTNPGTSGWCKFTDRDGDVTYEYYTGDLVHGVGGDGTAVFANGTGKYAGLRAEHTWTYHMTRHSDDAYEGHGQKHGVYWFEADEL